MFVSVTSPIYFTHTSYFTKHTSKPSYVFSRSSKSCIHAAYHNFLREILSNFLRPKQFFFFILHMHSFAKNKFNTNTHVFQQSGKIGIQLLLKCISMKLLLSSDKLLMKTYRSKPFHLSIKLSQFFIHPSISLSINLYI